MDRTQMEPHLHQYSFLLDLFVEEWSGSGGDRIERPIVGAEIEAYPQHGVTDDIDSNDYQWDFYKLLHVSVPRRLFVGCSRRERLDDLEASLVAARRRTSADLADSEESLAVILLPAVESGWAEVRLGIASGLGPLEFRRAAEFHSA